MDKPIAVGDRVARYTGFDHPRTGIVTERIYADGVATHVMMDYEPSSCLAANDELQVLLPAAERIAA